jgi:hypothetical protein
VALPIPKVRKRTKLRTNAVVVAAMEKVAARKLLLRTSRAMPAAAISGSSRINQAMSSGRELKAGAAAVTALWAA